MDENIGYNGAYTGQEIDQAIGAVRNKEATWDKKQDKLTGVQGQVVGFDDEGDAVAMPAPDTGVTTFNGRTGTVTPQSGDYTADMVGARGSDWTPTADEVGAVSVSRTINGKALNADITLGAGDVGAVPTTTTVNGKALSGNISLTADDVGARPNTWTPSADDVGAIPASAKGAASGVAELDGTGRVPSTQLPSYVDDVLEYDTLSSFPPTGEDGKIYVAEDTNRQYRWSGSQYVEISPSLALGETSSTAYRGDRGKIAYDHSQIVTGNPHGTTAADVGAVPTDRTVNGKALSADISLSAADVGALTQAQGDGRYLQLSGGILTGALKYSDDSVFDISNISANTGGSLQLSHAGDMHVANIRVENINVIQAVKMDDEEAPTLALKYVVTPTNDTDAANKAYVDAAKPVLRSATLTASGWSGNSQTVTVSGVVADTSAQLIYVSPANKASATAWGEAGVFCSAQGANSLTFVCDSTPSASINVNISIQEAQT